MVLARKFAIIAIGTFVQSDIRQLHFVLAVLIVALHLHDNQKPFGRRDASENAGVLHRLEMWSLLVLLFLLWCGIYFYVSQISGTGVCNEDGGVCSLLAVGVMGSNGLYIAAVTLQGCRKFAARKSTGAKRLRGKVSDLAAQFRSKQPRKHHPGVEMRLNPMATDPADHAAVGGSGDGDGERKGEAKGEGDRETNPLPRGSSFKRYVSADGHPYFVDDATGESVWRVPAHAVVTS